MPILTLDESYPQQMFDQNFVTLAEDEATGHGLIDAPDQQQSQKVVRGYTRVYIWLVV